MLIETERLGAHEAGDEDGDVEGAEDGLEDAGGADFAGDGERPGMVAGVEGRRGPGLLGVFEAVSVLRVFGETGNL